jgi:hypothetical protein
MQKVPRSIWTKLQIGCFQLPEDAKPPRGLSHHPRCSYS